MFSLSSFVPFWMGQKMTLPSDLLARSSKDVCTMPFFSSFGCPVFYGSNEAGTWILKMGFEHEEEQACAS